MKSRISFAPVSIAVSMLLIFVWTDDIRLFLFKHTAIAYIFLLLGFSIIVLCLLPRRMSLLSIQKIEFLWLLTFILVLFRNANLENGVFNYPIQYTVIVLCVPLLTLSDKWIEGFIKCILILSIIYAVVTIGSCFFRDEYLNMIVPMIPQEYHREMIAQFSSSRIPGMTSHYSTNGIYLGLGCGIMLVYFYTSQKKFTALRKIVSTLIFVALLITGKRAQSLFCLSSLFFLYYVYSTNKKKGRLLKITLIVVGIVIGILCLSLFIPDVMNVIIRLQSQISSGDLFTGRLVFYEKAIKSFWESPLFGKGWRSEWYSQGIDVHNVYIQLLAETGIVGFGFFMFIFLSTLVVTIKRLKYIRCLPEEYSSTYKSNEEKILSISLYVQCFFLQYCLTGNPLYDEQTLYVYVLACIMSYGYLYRENKNLQIKAES